MIQYNFIIRYALISSLMITFTFGKHHTLKSLSVVFRHGDRLPTDFYKTDPYKKYSFYPLEIGDLTNAGKLREYKLGQFLRQRYDGFLGKEYVPSDIFTYSDSVNRVKMSLLLVLAGLYPPRGKQIWKKHLKWQPIPMQYVPQPMDPIFTFYSCPTYQAELSRIINSTEFKAKESQFDGLMRNLTYFTGQTINTTLNIYILYHNLNAERSMNLRLPEWTKDYYPDGSMVDTVLWQYHLQSYNTLLKKLNGGMAVRTILNKMLAVVNGTSTKKLKINLLSGHEINIAGILNTLNIWKKDIPEYSAAIIFELHENKSKYFVKILYYKGIPAEYEQRRLPGCSDFCPIEDFIRLTKDVVPNDIFEACFGPPSNSLLVPKGNDPIKWIYEQFRTWYSL